MSHLQDINPIYHNSFGVAFQWKRNKQTDIRKVQLVFRDTGLLLSKKELKVFQKNIKCTMESNTLCEDCQNKETCRALLLDTPAPQVTLAMSHKEINALYDLVQGTLFQLDLDSYLNKVMKGS